MLFSVLKFIGIFLEVLLLFNFVIFFHELGHFLAAKWRGLIVEEFAIWFGKPIWRKKIGGVWFALNSIPFGGYVKLPQLANGDIEGKLESDTEKVPTAKPLDKIIVAAAGPLFSFMLAVFFAVIVSIIGYPQREAVGTTTVGEVALGSPAEKAGLQPGDEILSIDGIAVRRFVGQGDDAITWRVARAEGDIVPIVIRRDGKEITVQTSPTRPEKTVVTRRKTRELGVIPASTPRVGTVSKTGPAQEAGLQQHDFITHINGQKLYQEGGIEDYLAKNPADSVELTIERGAQVLKVPFRLPLPKAMLVEEDSPGARAGLKKGDIIKKVDGTAMKSASGILEYVIGKKAEAMKFVVERDGKELPEFTITPAEAKLPEGGTRPRIGVAFGHEYGMAFNGAGREKSPTPGVFEQIQQSAMAIFNTIDAVTSSKSDISIQHLGGPVMMMNVYYRLFEQQDGWKLAFWFSVILNVNLALMNLLPIPPLDGSHITFATIAALKRRPEAADELMNSKPVQWITTGGTLMILSFMLYVTLFDIQDLFGGGRSKKFPYVDKARAEATY